MTPFMEMYGYYPPSITSSIRDSKVEVVEDDMEQQQQVLQFLGQPQSSTTSNETTGRSTL